MADVRLELSDKKQGAFNLYEAGKKLGEMVIDIAGSLLTVYHTEVNPEVKSKGYARQLLDTMVAYAQAHQLKVLPICPYVLAQFRRHPDLYADVWDKQIA